jgi:predicted enzyme related to lactoylglutathione lyase
MRVNEIQVNIDCADPKALRAFYCEALGYEPYGEFGDYVSCVPVGGEGGPKIIFQRVPESKAVKNRVHLDLVVDDIEAEAERFGKLGATRVSAEPVSDGDCAWIVMRDPEGNELCLCRA